MYVAEVHFQSPFIQSTDGQRMEATGLFSACNLLDGSQVTLTCSDPVLFTLSHKLVDAATS